MKPLFFTLFIICLIISCKDKKVDNPANQSKQIADIQQVVGVGKIEPENEIIQLSAELGGVVEHIFKSENDTVNKGDIIVELKHSVEDANIIELKGASEVQNAQIKVDENAINESQIRFANSSVELKRLKSLFEKGAETQQVIDNATTEMQSFQATLKKLQSIVEVSKMKRKESKAQVFKAEVLLQQKFIKAPVNGIILELNIQKGNYIDNKQIVAQLNPEGKTIAVCEIDELFANKIKIGQVAIIRNSGALDTLTSGKVYFVGSFLKQKSLFTDQPGEKEDRRVREIKILLDNPTSILLNSRVECVISISKNN